jgi:Holliday junction resolvase
MSLKTKAKGSRNERKSIRLLEASGYQCTRAAGSLGAWDIIGIGPTDVVLCQVKSNEWPGRLEMETMREFTCPRAGVRRLVHRWRDYARSPDVRVIE